MMGTKNTLFDLNDHLFAQMERLGDESLTQEQLAVEIERSKALSGVAQQVISNANTILSAARFNDEKLDAGSSTPRLLIGDGC